MTDLREQLERLAEEAPYDARPGELWRRGKRRQRTRRTGTLAIVAATGTVMSIIGAASWVSASSPGPAAEHAIASLPSKIYAPSGWLSGSAELGPPGQLAAVNFAERHSWLGSKAGVVGISARTGEYAFLDLPQQVGAKVALSPDGNHIAYWIAGETSGAPNISEDEATPIGGVAVFNTSTGKVVRDELLTEHGLSDDDLLWADNETVVWNAMAWRGGRGDSLISQGSAEDLGLRMWVPASGHSEVLTLPRGADTYLFNSAVDGRLVLSGSRENAYWILDLRGAESPRRIVLTNTVSSYLVLDATGTRAATVWGNASDSSENPNELVAGKIGAPSVVGGSVELALPRVPRSDDTFRVLSWIDGQHVSVIRRSGLDLEFASVFDVDIVTGDAKEVIAMRVGATGFGVELATDLLGHPTVQGRQPPSPLDPRLVWSLVVSTALLGVFSMARWRRRVRV